MHGRRGSRSSLGRFVFLTLIVTLITGMLLALDWGAVAAKSQELGDSALLASGSQSSLQSLLCSCYGEKTENAWVADHSAVESEITLSCAPAGSVATKVDVHVALGRGSCDSQLNLRLDTSLEPVKSTFLQQGSCPGGAGSYSLDFTDSTSYDGVPVNQTWKLTVRDVCDGCEGYFVSWWIRVYYETPTSTPTKTYTPTATPVTPGPTRTASPTSTPTRRPTATPTEPPQCDPAIEVSKEWISPAGKTAEVGDTITYQFMVTNTGNVPLYYTNMWDSWPSMCLSYQSFSSTDPTVAFQYEYAVTSALRQAFFYHNGSLPPNGVLSFTADFLATASCGVITDTFDVITSGTCGPLVEASDEEQGFIGGDRSLDVSKTLQTPQGGQANVGDNVTFAMSVENTSSVPMLTVPVTDSFPAGCLEFLSSGGPVPNVVDNSNGFLKWNNVGPIGAGSTINWTVTFRAIGPCAPAENCMRIESIEFPQQEHWILTPPAQACAAVNIGPGSDRPAIHVDKHAHGVPPSGVYSPGDIVHFTLEIACISPAIRTLRVVDEFPVACFSFVSANPLPDSVDALTGTLVWNDVTAQLGDMTLGDVAIIDLFLRAEHPCGFAINHVTGTGWKEDVSSHPDPMSVPHDVSHGEEAVDILLYGTHLQIDKIGPRGCVSDTLAYDIAVRNIGTDPIDSMCITDTYDTGCLSFQGQSSVPLFDPTDDGDLEWCLVGAPHVLVSGESLTMTVEFHLENPCAPTLNMARVQGWSAPGGSDLAVSELPIFIDPLGACEPQFLPNGDFEMGDFSHWNTWAMGGLPEPSITHADVHGGSSAAKLGGLVRGVEGIGYCGLYRELYIPANVGAVWLTYWYKLVVPPGNPPGPSGDAFTLGVSPPPLFLGPILPPPVTWSTGGWVQGTVDLSPWIGKLASLYFTIRQNGQQGPPSLLLDDVEVCFASCGPPEEPTPRDKPGFCWKCGDYPDYAPACVPDFDQRQGGWRSDQGDVWTHSGPAALANCFWWFDSKFESGTAPPPAISDSYPLVDARYGEWDDHDARNVVPLIEDLAGHVHTDEYGTRPYAMEEGIMTWLTERELIDQYSVQVMKQPHFTWVRDQIVRCENVLLLLGEWEFTVEGWRRLRGHWVTGSGVSCEGLQIAINDPLLDSAELGYPGWYEPFGEHGHPDEPPDRVHNDAAYVSHDIYDATFVATPGGSWALRDYMREDPMTGEAIPDVRTHALNRPPELAQWQAERRLTGPVVTSVEYAIAISPLREASVLWLAPALGDVRVAETIPVQIMLDTGQWEATSAAVHLDFDPNHLQLVDREGEPTGEVLLPQEPRFPVVVANEANNETGWIDLVVEAGEGNFVGGRILLGTLRFRGVAEHTEGVRVVFSPEPDRESQARFGETPILDDVEGSRIRVLEAREIVVHVDLQGRPEPPDENWIAPVVYGLHEPGSESPLRIDPGHTDDVGDFPVTGILPGLYDVSAKGLRTLRNVRWDVEPEDQVVNLGELIAGDANNDNAINGVDLSLLATTYGRSEGQERYDSRADFDGDHVVGEGDLDLLRGNFGLAGDQYLGPAVASAAGKSAPIRLMSAGGDVFLAIEPAEVAGESEEVFAFRIVVDAGDQPVDTVELYLIYPPDDLTIVNTAGNPVSRIAATAMLPVVVANNVDSDLGAIEFTATTAGGGVPTGEFVVARFRVRAEAAGLDSWILFGWDETHTTDVLYQGQSVLGRLQGAHVSTIGAGGIYLPLIVKKYGAAAVVLFQDDFDDGQLTGWTSNLGTWTNPGDHMRGQYSLGNSWNIKNVSGTDFTYEGTLTLKSGNAAGLVFRSNADGTESYDAIIDIVDGVFKISRRTPYTVLGQYSFTPQYDTAYDVKVVARGSTLEGYLDGVKRITVLDSMLSSGKFGVMVFCATAEFDDLAARE